jgi:hypothetical protein
VFGAVQTLPCELEKQHGCPAAPHVPQLPPAQIDGDESGHVSPVPTHVHVLPTIGE